MGRLVWEVLRASFAAAYCASWLARAIAAAVVLEVIARSLMKVLSRCARNEALVPGLFGKFDCLYLALMAPEGSPALAASLGRTWRRQNFESLVLSYYLRLLTSCSHSARALTQD